VDILRLEQAQLQKLWRNKKLELIMIEVSCHTN
jgi:hypothetical protein